MINLSKAVVKKLGYYQAGYTDRKCSSYEKNLGKLKLRQYPIER